MTPKRSQSTSNLSLTAELDEEAVALWTEARRRQRAELRAMRLDPADASLSLRPGVPLGVESPVKASPGALAGITAGWAGPLDPAAIDAAVEAMPDAAEMFREAARVGRLLERERDKHERLRDILFRHDR